MYHLIGIGGIGMSALAHLLIEKGIPIRGSDSHLNSLTQELQKRGAEIDSFLLPDPLSTVVFSSAITQDHPEYQHAIKQKLPVLHRSQLLTHLMEGYRPLLVAGSHGKTTTASLLAHLLTTAQKNPAFILGGVSLNLKKNGGHGEGEYFVAEVDESDGSFLNHHAYGAILTNLDEEHLEYWETAENLIRGFEGFAKGVATLLWWCADDPLLTALSLKGESYGFASNATLQITHWVQRGWTLSFDITYREVNYKNIELPLTGKHNVSNAAAVFGMGLQLNLEEATLRQAFANFKGTKKRMEKKEEKGGVSFYDDYAHHPNEIKTTLEGVRLAAPERRIVFILQPHRYSRLKHLWHPFISSLQDADLLILTDIYSAGEEPLPGIEIEKFYEETQQKLPLPIYYFPRKELALKTISLLQPHDIVVTAGAGDITHLHEELLQHSINPLHIAIIQGGKSAEHSISLLSAQKVIENLNPVYYQIHPFTISKKGEWSTQGKKTMLEVVEELLQCDIAFPVLHGPQGEDGMVQAFLETLDVPSIGSDFRASAVAMDKAWSKRIALSYGIKVARFLEFSSHQWKTNPEELLASILQTFSYPFYVKALHLGSSVGVYRVLDPSLLVAALDQVVKLDYAFLIEEEIKGKEIEFGCLGHHNIQISDPIENFFQGKFYTYEKKYHSNHPTLLFDPSIPCSAIEEGKRLTEKIYRSLRCSGLARVDFFFTPSGEWILNEINPIPGFASTSAYPQMWKKEKLSPSELIDEIIISSLHRYRYRERSLKPSQ